MHGKARAVEVKGLCKSFPYGHIARKLRPALVELDLSVERGEVFGCLGPNGAGKTTTLKALLGLIRPDRGTAFILGVPNTDPGWRRKAGYLPEHPYFYDYLSAAEYLDYSAALLGLPKQRAHRQRSELLEKVGLDSVSGMPLRRFSKGMLQRLGLAQALIGDPEIVFLDEPMSGLDPFGRRLVREIILDLKKQGTTVFFSTHILSDAEALCDRVAVLHGGRLVSQGLLSEILRVDVTHMEVLASGVELGPGLAEAISCQRVGERLRLQVPEHRLLGVLESVQAGGGRILAVQPVRQSLEEYFFRELGQVPGETMWQD